MEIGILLVHAIHHHSTRQGELVQELPYFLSADLDTAITQLEAADCRAYLAAAKRQKGLFIGRDEGAQLVQEADDWFTYQGVKNPERFANMLAPGFSRKV